jgi:hypothetical protein
LIVSAPLRADPHISNQIKLSIESHQPHLFETIVLSLNILSLVHILNSWLISITHHNAEVFMTVGMILVEHDNIFLFVSN